MALGLALMFTLKPGVQISGVKPELVIGLLVVEEVLRSNGFDLVVTEVTGGKHMQGSLHYQGLAADIRSKNLPDVPTKLKVLKEAQLALGENFDMILENVGSSNEHFHIEVQT